MLNALTNWIKPNALVGQNVNHMARVLIIDDDIDSAKLLGEYLSQHNYQVAYEISSINAVSYTHLRAHET